MLQRVHVFCITYGGYEASITNEERTLSEEELVPLNELFEENSVTYFGFSTYYVYTCKWKLISRFIGNGKLFPIFSCM